MESEEEEDDDDEDEMEDDDSEIELRNKKKRNRKNNYIGQYIDEIAEDDDEHYDPRENERDEKLIEQYQKPRTNYVPNIQDDEDLIEKEYEEKNKAYKNEIIQEKYDNIKIKRNKKYSVIFFDKPTLSDPKLFMVNCKIGTEQETAIGIMKKYFDQKKT